LVPIGLLILPRGPSPWKDENRRLFGWAARHAARLLSWGDSAWGETSQLDRRIEIRVVTEFGTEIMVIVPTNLRAGSIRQDRYDQNMQVPHRIPVTSQ